MFDPNLTLIITIVIFSSVAFVLLDTKILSTLKNDSPDIYDELGKPSLWVNLGTKYSYWFVFLLLGRFRKFDLPKSTRKLCVVNQVAIAAIILLVFIWVCEFT